MNYSMEEIDANIQRCNSAILNLEEELVFWIEKENQAMYGEED